MIIPPILELSVIGLYDAGIPNRERIVLRPTEAVNLAQFAVLVGVATTDSVTPLRDLFFWFGERIIEPPSYVILYTGKGQDLQSKIEATGEPVHVMHWGSDYTIFGNPAFSLVPLVIRIGAIASAPTIYPPSPPPVASLPR